MENPFTYSHTVTGESFCNRKREIEDLTDFTMNSENVLLYAHRRNGKTSLVEVLINKLKKKSPSVKIFYIDLYGTLDENDFIKAVFASFSQNETKIEKLAKKLKSLFTSIKPKLSYNLDSGVIEAEASYDSEERALVFNEVLESLAKYSSDSRILVIFDEFQEITNYSDETIEKRLRKIIQRHNNVCYIFMGSQRHLLQQMFTNNDRALYKLAEPYPLKRIATCHYITWIQTLYKKYRKFVPERYLINEVIDICENHPLYIQQFFYFLWQEENITTEIIKKTETKILQRRFYEYANIWDKLTPNQRKASVLICLTSGEKVYKVDNLKMVGIKGPSQLKRSIEYLVENDHIYKNGKYRFNDVMFKKWIKNLIVKKKI